MAQTSTHSDPRFGSQSMSEQAMELGEQAMEGTTAAVVSVRDTVQDYPIVTLALVAGVAMAAGALWKIGQTRRQTRVDSLLARLSELQNQLPRRWQM